MVHIANTVAMTGCCAVAVHNAESNDAIILGNVFQAKFVILSIPSFEAGCSQIVESCHIKWAWEWVILTSSEAIACTQQFIVHVWRLGINGVVPPLVLVILDTNH